MTGSEFRRSESVVRGIMATLDNELFWEAYLHLLMFRRQAFLPCALSVGNLAKGGGLDFSSVNARRVAEWLETEAADCCVKVMDMMMPKMRNVEQIVGLMNWLKMVGVRERIAMLMKVESVYAYYVLFGLLKEADDMRLTRQCCVSIMKKSTDLAFNMSSILLSYFGLNDIRSTFSLRIEPYELSYLDRSFDTFSFLLTGRKPKV